MRKFNLRPVSIALLGITTSTVYANNNAEVNSAQQLATIVVSAAGYEQKLKRCTSQYYGDYRKRFKR